MVSRFKVSALTLTLTTGLIAAGCGADASLLSPIGPSVSGGSSRVVTSEVAGASSVGEVDITPAGRGDHGKGDHGKVDADHGQKDNAHRVEANGAITSLNVTARTLSVGTTHVSVPAATPIRHGSTTVAFADLKVGDHVEVKGTLNATAVLVASEVKVEQGGHGHDGDAADDDDDDDKKDDAVNRVELTGAVSALTGSCLTALGFTVQTKLVVTTATTTFRGTTCAAIAVGTVVEVKGTTQANGTIAAVRVSAGS